MRTHTHTSTSSSKSIFELLLSCWFRMLPASLFLLSFSHLRGFFFICSCSVCVWLCGERGHYETSILSLSPLHFESKTYNQFINFHLILRFRHFFLMLSFFFFYYYIFSFLLRILLIGMMMNWTWNDENVFPISCLMYTQIDTWDIRGPQNKRQEIALVLFFLSCNVCSFCCLKARTKQKR